MLVWLLLALFGSVCSQTIRLNLGGGNYLDSSGNQWYAESGDYDFRVTGVETVSSISIPAGTPDKTLYDTHIESDADLVWSIPYNQSIQYFEATFLFAETNPQFNAAQLRLFDIFIEGTQFRSSVDVFASVGLNAPYKVGPIKFKACGARLEIVIAQKVSKTMASALFITPASSPDATLTCANTTVYTAPKTAKHHYSEALHKIFYYYESIRAGNLTGNSIRRPAWRLNSFGDVSNVNVPGSGKTVDASGGYMDSSSRVKYGQPLAFTWTTISWGAIQFRNGYERTGEITYLRDALKWAARYFINIHPEPNKLIGQVGNSVTDSQYCGPSEYFNLTRDVYWLTENNPGSEVAAETAAALASGSIVMNWTDPTLANEMLTHAIQLYQFAKYFNGSVSKSIPDSALSYASSGFSDELAWAAAWLYKATMNVTYLYDAERYHTECCIFYAGYGYTYDEKNVALNVLLSQLTTKRKFTVLAKTYFDQWLPGNDRVIYHTKYGLGYRSEWGTFRYSVNTAFLMMVYADFLQLEDGNSGRNFTENSYQKKLFDYAVSQIDYVLGTNRYNRSFLIGFGNNPPDVYYHMGSYYPATNFQGNLTNCQGNFYNSDTRQPVTLYGALMSGPSISDEFPFGKRDSPQRTQPFQDFPAALSGALSKLVEYYNLDSYCGELDSGYNLTSPPVFVPAGFNTQQVWCQSPTSFTYYTPTGTGTASDGCLILNNWDLDTEGWAVANPPLGSELNVTWVNGALQLNWFNEASRPADFFLSTYEYGHGVDWSRYSYLKWDMMVPNSTYFRTSVTLATENWAYIEHEKLVEMGPGLNKLEFNLKNLTGLENVWAITIDVSPEILGYGHAIVDNLRLCRSADVISTSTSSTASSRSRGTAVRSSYVDENHASMASPLNWLILLCVLFRFL
eukprot:TRINITY_DN2124_c0_g1_i1.p1 TRINITY_DN2124_c0_g1~~TRINITY_DN2124_c0_g1_i1.p1  ORF type:complete len:909 (+),score=181.69 TRINITY_DN2124_c0_g1_i1:72-2798(+)